jgi:hypothetical protein
MKQLALHLILIVLSITSHAQSVAINNTGAVAANSALLDISSNTKGILVPRMNKAQKNAITSPATGLLIYQDAPDSTGFYYYSGTAWLWLAIANNTNDWRTIGNIGTDTSVNFIGTTDNMPIRFKQNNNWIGQFNSNNSNFFIGTNSGKITTASTNTAFGANSLASNITGVGNLAMGAAAMSLSTSGSRNTAIGDSAMYTNSFNNGGVAYAMDNTALGSKALFFNQPTTNSNGYKNTAIGSEALYLNTTGFENTAVGTGALHDNISGNQNTAVGRSANRLAKSGINNTYIGFEAGYSDSIANNNVGIGHQALRQSSGGQNTALGSGALLANTTGGSNVSIGYSSLSANTGGGLNTALGQSAMFTNTIGTNNTAIGALANVTVGNLTNATAIGTRATVAQSNALVLGSITGINGAFNTVNVGIGTNAPNTTSSLDISSTSRGILIPRMSKAQKNAIATPATGLLVYQNSPDSVGFYYYSGATWLWMSTATNVNGWATIGNAGTDTTVNFIGTTTNMPLRFKVNNQWNGQFEPNNSNYFIGINAGRLSTGIVNTAFGSSGLANNTSGSFNTAFGGGAMISNTTGSSNVAVGNTALANHKLGDNNVAIGTNAMNADTASYSNVAVGGFAMLNGKQSNSNTAVGFFSLANAGINSTNGLDGNFNTAVGHNSALAITKGFGNVAVGQNSLAADTTGTANSALGSGAMSSFIGGSGNVAIGFFAFSNGRGSSKVAVGRGALSNDTSANGNTAIGSFALLQNRRGVNNVAVGAGTMASNFSGSRNVAFGDSALINNSFLVSSGNHFTNNTALGYKALFNNLPTSAINGNDNTAVGNQSGFTNASGSGNTFIGSLSNATSTSLVNATAIGYQSLVSQNNSMVLGSVNGINGATSSVNIGIGTNTPNARFHIRDNGTSGGTFNANSSLIIEDNTTSYIQLSHPSSAQTGILSGNDLTTIRSGILFNADSSITLRAGGNVNRVTIDNTGFVGIRNIAPLSYLDVAGSTGNAISALTISTSLDQFDHTHIILPTSSTVTITLPAALSCTRREYVIVNQDNTAHNFSITYLDFTGTPVTTIPINSSITIQSNGISWFRIR